MPLGIPENAIIAAVTFAAGLVIMWLAKRGKLNALQLCVEKVKNFLDEVETCTKHISDVADKAHEALEDDEVTEEETAEIIQELREAIEHCTPLLRRIPGYKDWLDRLTDNKR